MHKHKPHPVTYQSDLDDTVKARPTHESNLHTKHDHLQVTHTKGNIFNFFFEITYMEIVDAMTKMKINFMCQQKTMWVGEKAKELDSSRYKH
ncbi:hypothetical protein MTR_2g058750 [Medicago truncatula]|uniref:Uncharacterized protein n=1 Tax=Medicago truncatula TaxID=3880 RepID=A0A072VIP8_MEDTR|nr:hypothetical protein MTR_2g058750 [Medicago truncatula]